MARAPRGVPAVTGARIPAFAELPVRPGAPPGSSWGVFGERDDLGTLNFIGAAEVRAAAGLVRKGAVFALSLPVDLPAPAFFGRAAPRHTIFTKYEGVAADDYLDGFWPQASTQWDGLRHFSEPGFGFYDGVTLAEATQPGGGRLGVDHWARRGIVARAVLVDVARAVSLDPLDFYPVGVALIEQILLDQGVELRDGDVLLLRTGWVEAYEALSPPERAALAADGKRPGSPGLHGDDVPAFLWDNRIAAVAADNPALEAAHAGSSPALELHHALIAKLGMALGELWSLAALAADCAGDGVFEAMLTSAPLNLPGGVGSPANALALK